MQGIYTYIPEKNYVHGEYSVAAILLLQFMVLISLVPELNLLYFYISTFRTMCAVPNMAVFCSSLTSWFPGMLLMLLVKVKLFPILNFKCHTIKTYWGVEVQLLTCIVTNAYGLSNHCSF